MPLPAKLKKEKAFLKYLLKNTNENQSKKFLTHLTSDNQYEILREIVENAAQGRIPFGRKKKDIESLLSSQKSKIKDLREGNLDDNKLHSLLPLFRHLIHLTLKHFSTSSA